MKLDELIHGVRGARTELVDLEYFTDEELEKLQGEIKALHEKLTRKLSKRQK